MPAKYKILLTIFIVVLALGVGVFLSYQYQNVIQEDFEEVERTEEPEPEARTLTWEDISYREENSVPTLLVTGEDGKRILSENYPSHPKISPEGNYLSFVAPSEWEQIGTLYKYDYSEDEIITLVEGEDLPDQHTVKKFWWLDEEIKIFIGGFSYGTVSVGGTLYAQDLQSGKMVEVFEPTERREVKDIDIEKAEGEIKLQIAEFDEDFIDYEIIVEYIEIDSIYEQLGE